MIEDLISLLAFAVVLFLFPLAAILFSKLISPHKPNPVKNSTFECGEIPEGEGRTQFMIQYYGYAIVFTLFDTLALFLFASSVALTSIEPTMLGSLLIFVGIVALALLYIWQSFAGEYTYTPRE